MNAKKIGAVTVLEGMVPITLTRYDLIAVACFLFSKGRIPTREKMLRVAATIVQNYGCVGYCKLMEKYFSQRERAEFVVGVLFPEWEETPLTEEVLMKD